MKPCLSVVIPCFNEEATIEPVVQRVLDSSYVREVIVVDDGSADGTLERALGITNGQVRVLAQPFNMGKGAALRRGFREATSELVIVQDADLEYDPADYETVLEPLLDGRADVVFGSRFHTTRPHRVLYYWHSVGNRILTTASNVFTNLNLSDMETCYKAFRREVIESIDIEEDRFGFEPEITAKVASGGWRIYEVGISYSGRSYEEGKKIGWKDGFRAMYCVVRYSPPVRRLTRTRGRNPADFPSADENLSEVLSSLEMADHYADWIAELAQPHLGAKVIEIGAGHGAITERLSRHSAVVATDVSLRCTALLSERFADDPSVTVDQGDLADMVTRHPGDTFILVNVLEHIEDDVGALRLMRDVLPEEGRVILFVPAFESLYSKSDAQMGHHRRYNRRTLRRALADAGLEPVELHYVNMIGAFAWWLTARVLGLVPTRRGLVVAYDRLVIPLLRSIERRHRPPFGQSLFCVAKVSSRDT